MSGRLPLPVRLADEDHWSRDQLDAALDRLLGVRTAGDWRKHQPGLSDAA